MSAALSDLQALPNRPYFLAQALCRTQSHRPDSPRRDWTPHRLLDCYLLSDWHYYEGKQEESQEEAKKWQKWL